MKNALVAITVAFMFCSTLMAQGDDETTRNSLKGLTGIAVEVSPIDVNAEKDGLSKDQIRTDVELRLRSAGIKVLTLQESLLAPGVPYLNIMLDALKSRASKTWVIALEVSLRQGVALTRDPKVVVVGTTWNAEGVAVVGTTKIAQTRDSIRDLVDKFITAWQSVNPKH
jgi:hypothetical protein